MKLYVSHPVFPTPDIVKTVEYYADKIGFRRDGYSDANEKHICLYRDDVEFCHHCDNKFPRGNRRSFAKRIRIT